MKGRFGVTASNISFWSKTGAAIIEIDTTLLTIRSLGECRVWSEHFGQAYVSNRCIAEVHPAPLQTFTLNVGFGEN